MEGKEAREQYCDVSWDRQAWKSHFISYYEAAHLINYLLDLMILSDLFTVNKKLPTGEGNVYFPDLLYFLLVEEVGGKGF